MVLVVSTTPTLQSPHSRKDPVPIVKEVEWVSGEGLARCGKSYPNEIGTLDPATY